MLSITQNSIHNSLHDLHIFHKTLSLSNWEYLQQSSSLVVSIMNQRLASASTSLRHQEAIDSEWHTDWIEFRYLALGGFLPYTYSLANMATIDGLSVNSDHVYVIFKRSVKLSVNPSILRMFQIQMYWRVIRHYNDSLDYWRLTF